MTGVCFVFNCPLVPCLPPHHPTSGETSPFPLGTSTTSIEVPGIGQQWAVEHSGMDEWSSPGRQSTRPRPYSVLVRTQCFWGRGSTEAVLGVGSGWMWKALGKNRYLESQNQVRKVCVWRCVFLKKRVCFFSRFLKGLEAFKIGTIFLGLSSHTLGLCIHS